MMIRGRLSRNILFTLAALALGAVTDPSPAQVSGKMGDSAEGVSMPANRAKSVAASTVPVRSHVSKIRRVELTSVDSKGHPRG